MSETDKPITPIESLTKAGVKLSERELSIVAATTAHVRAATSHDLLGYLAGDDAVTRVMSDETIEKLENYVEMSLLQHGLSRLLVVGLAEAEDEDA